MFFAIPKGELDNGEMRPGETLFEYLKRKKHIALKQSLQSSFKKSSQIQKSPPKKQVNQKEKKQYPNCKQRKQPDTKRKSRKSSSKKHKVNISNQSYKQNNPNTIRNTDKSFDDKTTKRMFINNENLSLEVCEGPPQRRQHRSFISMISPLKSKQTFGSLSNTKIFTKIARQNRDSRKQKAVSELKLKNMVKDSLRKIQSKFQEQLEFENEIKEKLKQFLLLLNSMFVQLEQQQCSDALSKKSKLVRSNAKLINNYVMNQQQSNSQGAAELIDDLYKSINQQLDGIEGQIKERSQFEYEKIVQSAKDQHFHKLQQVQKQKSRLSRQINFANKESQKLQREKGKLLEENQKLQQTIRTSQEIKNFKQQSQIMSLEQQLLHEKAQNTSLKKQINNLHKRLKDQEYKFQEYSTNCHKDYEERINERERFLLKEINLLKMQCSKDVKSLNQLHLNKEQKSTYHLKYLENTISQQSQIIEKMKDNLKQVEEMLKIQQASVDQEKTKSQNSLLDLYRMNEELYKHWMALKDVKVLLSRLNVWDKFQRIYKDIPFDQLLFFS